MENGTWTKSYQYEPDIDIIVNSKQHQKSN